MPSAFEEDNLSGQRHASTPPGMRATSAPRAGRLLVAGLALILLGAPFGSRAETGEANRLLELERASDVDGSTLLRLVTDRPVPEAVAFVLLDPPRLVVDLPGVQSRLDEAGSVVDPDSIERVRIGQHGSKLRVVFDAHEGGPGFEGFEKTLLPNGVAITLPLRDSPAPAVDDRSAVEKERKDVPPPAVEKKRKGVPPRFAVTAPVEAVPYSPPVLPAGMPLPPLPDQAAPTHLGVASCAGAPCHGSGVDRDTDVLQTEYIIWRSQDRHSVAYSALYNEQSKTIAKNLNLARLPHEEKLCLDCHADNVRPALRGERFSIEDGVGCEACHGGGEKYVAGHDYMQTNEMNVRQGMYPTDDPVARAELCLSCHFGTADKPLGHRLIGAGHPRLTFELQTFTFIQPAHFRYSRDGTRTDPRSADGATVWAAGQAVAGRKLLDQLIEKPSHGWPEFASYNCFNCHQEVDADSWRSDTRLAQGAGIPGVNTANLEILQYAIAGATPDGLGDYRNGLAALRGAASQPGRGVGDAARGLREQVQELTPRLAAWSVTPEAARDVLRGIFGSVSNLGVHDFLYAEQAVMALQVLIDQLDALGALQKIDRSMLRERMDALLASLANPRRFEASRTRRLFRDVEKTLR